jgi:hypothetical protein
MNTARIATIATAAVLAAAGAGVASAHIYPGSGGPHHHIKWNQPVATQRHIIKMERKARYTLLGDTTKSLTWTGVYWHGPDYSAADRQLCFNLWNLTGHTVIEHEVATPPVPALKIPMKPGHYQEVCASTPPTG